MKEIKGDTIHIKDKEVCLNDLCQVVAVSDDMPLLITQWFDFIGTRDECWDKINTTDVVPKKGSHLSIVTSKWYTVEREDW